MTAGGLDYTAILEEELMTSPIKYRSGSLFSVFGETNIYICMYELQKLYFWISYSLNVIQNLNLQREIENMPKKILN